MAIGTYLGIGLLRLHRLVSRHQIGSVILKKCLFGPDAVCRLRTLFPLKPMKHFSFFLTLLLLTACTRDPESGPAPGVGQTPMRKFYIPGVFRIKLRETAAELDTRALSRSGPARESLPIRCRRHPCRGNCRTACLFRWRPFPRTPPQGGLHLWYDVHFSGAISVAEAHGTLRPGG